MYIVVVRWPISTCAASHSAIYKITRREIMRMNSINTLNIILCYNKTKRVIYLSNILFYEKNKKNHSRHNIQYPYQGRPEETIYGGGGVMFFEIHI